MTRAGVVGRLPAPADGLLPFHPGRDLAAVVELLELGFDGDLEARDRQWLAELARISQLAGPLLHWLVRLVPPLSASLAGFVWYADGCLVGNASLMRGKGGVWVVANVVTRPDRRRRGIATGLMAAVVDAARRGGAREIRLQVRDDNEAAHALYRRLGFRRTHATAWLALASARAAVGAPVGAPSPADGDAVVKLGRGDGPAVRRLVARADADGAGVPPLVRGLAEERGVVERLAALLAPAPSYRFGVVRHGGLRVVGAASVGEAPDGHQMALAVDPSWRGRVEARVVCALLAALAHHAPVAVQAEVDAREDGAMRALEAAGFRRRRTLDRLTLSLR